MKISSSEPISLEGQVLTDTLALAVPQDILPMNGMIVVQDTRAPHAVQVFDPSGTLVAVTGNEGEGPREFVDPWGISERPGYPNQFWVYDLRLNRLTPFDLSALVAGAEGGGADNPVKLSSMIMESPHWLDDSTLVAINSMLAEGENRFALFGPDGNLLRTVGDPPPGDKSVPAFIRQQAYGGEIAVHPQRPLFVLASRYAGRLEVYRKDGTLELSIPVPFPFEPDYSPARDGINMVRGPDFRHGYISVDATEDHIYALFSGRTKEEYPDNANYGEYVHVFDWSGNLLRTLHLDVDASEVAVNEPEDRLYATQIEPYPQVVAYDLSSLDL